MAVATWNRPDSCAVRKVSNGSGIIIASCFDYAARGDGGPAIQSVLNFKTSRSASTYKALL